MPSSVSPSSALSQIMLGRDVNPLEYFSGPSTLSKFEWSAIEPLLPTKVGGGARVDDHCVLNGIFWRLRTDSLFGGSSGTLQAVNDVRAPLQPLAQGGSLFANIGS